MEISTKKYLLGESTYKKLFVESVADDEIGYLVAWKEFGEKLEKAVKSGEILKDSGDVEFLRKLSRKAMEEISANIKGYLNKRKLDKDLENAETIFKNLKQEALTFYKKNPYDSNVPEKLVYTRHTLPKGIDAEKFYKSVEKDGQIIN